MTGLMAQGISSETVDFSGILKTYHTQRAEATYGTTSKIVVLRDIRQFDVVFSLPVHHVSLSFSHEDSKNDG
jgi:hypothetical protein